MTAWQSGFSEEPSPEVIHDTSAILDSPSMFIPVFPSGVASDDSAAPSSVPDGFSNTSAEHVDTDISSPVSAPASVDDNISDHTDSSPLVDSAPIDNVPLHTHPMQTRGKSGIHKPNPKYVLLTAKSSYPEPKSVKAALKDSGWFNAMHEEYDSFLVTETFDLVPPSECATPLGCKWVFRTKLNADGSLNKLKARLVAKGYEQEEGIDYIETYSPVVRTSTVRAVLHVATTHNWTMKQLDVKNAFLHCDLKETVYMLQPSGFEDANKPDYICRLKKAIYGLKQAPRAWFDKFSSFLLHYGFKCSLADPSLFVYANGNNFMYLLLYVDDMIVTGSNQNQVDEFLEYLKTEFRMTDMGEIHYFLGVQAYHHSEGLFLNQSKYAADLLSIAGMSDCSPMPTPLPLQLDTGSSQKEVFPQPTYFRSLAGKLQYLTLTRPDIQFAVNFVCQKMHEPTMSDFVLLKRILRYVKGTLDMGINITKHTNNRVSAFSDSDWAGCKDTRRSTGGFCTFLGSNLISWSAKRHITVSKSSTEAEYRTLSLAASELAWIDFLICDLGISSPQADMLLCDNLSAMYLSANPVLNSRS